MRWAGRYAFLLCALAACMDGTTSEDPPDQSIEQRKTIPVFGIPELDLLFVVDTSPSMADEQASLAVNYARFGQLLETLDTPGSCQPNLHIGVISADLGTGPHSVAGCTATGDGAGLQSEPRAPECFSLEGSFIRDEVDTNGQHITNYSGALSDAIPCIAQLGAGGCRFQQPLEAMRRALDADTGFRREDAYLMAVLIADEDDCSAADVDLFDPAATVLGSLSTFRCFESGVACSPDDPRTPGAKTDCAPREDSPYLQPVAEYHEFLTGLAAPDILVATIAGNAEPVEVVSDAGDVTLAPSCASAAATATPAIRLEAFAAQFPQRNTVTSICNADVSDAIGDFFIRSLGGVPCLDGTLADADDTKPGVQPNCAVTEFRSGPEMPETATVLPRCDNPADPELSTNLPCYLTPEDRLGCPDTPTGLSFERHPPCALGSGHIEIRCLAE